MENDIDLENYRNKEIIKEHYLYRDNLEDSWYSWRINFDHLRKKDSSTVIDFNNFLLSAIKNYKKAEFFCWYISGELQIGKTKRIVAYLNEMILKYDVSVSYVNLFDLYERLLSKYEYKTFNSEMNLMIENAIKNSNILVIDDFKFISSLSSNEIMKHVTNAIERRMQVSKPIIFVSNYTLDENKSEYIKSNRLADKKRIEIFFERISKSCKSEKKL